VVVDRRVGEALRPDSQRAASDLRLKCPPKRHPLTDDTPLHRVKSRGGDGRRRHCCRVVEAMVDASLLIPH